MNSGLYPAPGTRVGIKPEQLQRGEVSINGLHDHVLLI